MIEEKMAPMHPGEVLKEDFLDPMGMSWKSWNRK
ncbi:hypothetical protein SBDP1_850054 [Syntrophobacter sp. SbD1]|nr:hypothetical protein SBDP1_850054 [Syntrophobacter sp. SbD1]